MWQTLGKSFNNLAFKGEAIPKVFRVVGRVGYTFLQSSRTTTQLLVIKAIYFQPEICLWRHSRCKFPNLYKTVLQFVMLQEIILMIVSSVTIFCSHSSSLILRRNLEQDIKSSDAALKNFSWL